MVILVTGASGFLGSVHVKQLLESSKYDKNDIRVLVRKTSKTEHLKKLGVELFQGELTSLESLHGIMTDVTDVYHLAAIVINEAVSSKVMYDVNVGGTKRLLQEFLQENSTQKFILASSIGVYGFTFPKKAVSEDYRKKPNNAYQKSKLMAEEVLWRAVEEHDIHCSAIRNPLITGPGDTVTSIRVCQALNNDQIKIMGDGTNKFSMVDARDSSKAMLFAANNPKAKREAFNVKSYDIKQIDYFTYYAQACGADIPQKHLPKWVIYLYAWWKELTTPKGKEVMITRTRVDRYSDTRMLDIAKIMKDLAFQPDYSNPKEVIFDSVNWLKERNLLPSLS
jgi:nucleoside-diphosphate-sugar epimerase